MVTRKFREKKNIFTEEYCYRDIDTGEILTREEMYVLRLVEDVVVEILECRTSARKADV